MKYIVDLTKPKDSEGNCIDPDYFPEPNWLEVVSCLGVIVCAVIIFVRWLL